MCAPEKFAMYFSTMNSLSSKIFSEVQLIDEAISNSESRSLSYDERCAVIDKRLIHDALHPSKSRPAVVHQGQEAEAELEARDDLDKELFVPVVFHDDCLDNSHTNSLIRFAYPKKPEKYIFDEKGCWVDEHSEPFSYWKQSQVKCCELEKMAENLLTEKSKVMDVNENSELKQRRRSKESYPKEEATVRKEVKKKAKAPFFGVNVMGMGLGDSSDSLVEKDFQRKQTNHKGEGNEQKGSNDEESNLPNQKQNLDLIAELQAKLNKNKITRNMGTPPPPPPETSKEKIKSPTAAVSPATGGKISKPKAPPPPPPVQKTAGVAKPTPAKSPPSSKGFKKLAEEVTVNSAGDSKKEEFTVDISSPSRIVTPKTGFDFLDNW